MPRFRLRTELASALAVAGLLSCREPPPPPAPAAAAVAAPAEVDIHVLPNNMAVRSGKHKLTAFKSDGEVLWELTLPEGDSIAAPVTSALNSVTYVRGEKALHAAEPEGKWAWSRNLEGRSSAKSRAVDTPVVFSDSTVAVVVADDVIRFARDGAVRWRLSVPEGRINGPLSAGMDGSLLVPTSAGIYSVTPDGSVAWRKAIGG